MRLPLEGTQLRVDRMYGNPTGARELSLEETEGGGLEEKVRLKERTPG